MTTGQMDAANDMLDARLVGVFGRSENSTTFLQLMETLVRGQLESNLYCLDRDAQDIEADNQRQK